MSKYLLIESRDPFESNDVPHYYELAGGLVAAGHEVTLFLVQNGVMPSRGGTRAEGLATLARSGVTVLADEFSLRERAFPTDQMVSGVTPAPLEIVIDHMADGCKTMWH